MTFPLMPVVSPGTTTTPTPGVTWETITSAVVGTNSLRYNSNSGTGTWVVAGNSGAAFRSTDGGSTWASSTFSTGQMTGIAYGNSLFAVTQYVGNDIYTSANGSAWTTNRDNNQIRYNDGYFVLGSGTGGGSGFVYASADGVNWTYGAQGAVGANSARCGIYVASLGRTFAGGSEYKYNNAVPTAATAWAGTPTGLTGVVRDIAWSPALSIAVIVGDDGIFSSTNLTSWTSRVSIITANSGFSGIAWCSGQFVAVGTAGKIFTSLNGTTWTPRTSGTTNALYGVSESGGVIIVTGETGTILRSS
jgi:hypothetical protein